MDTDNYNSSYCVLKSLYWMFIAVILIGCSDEFNAGKSVENNSTPIELLRAEEAFLYAVHDTGQSIKINWSINDGYYLYQKKLKFQSDEISYSHFYSVYCIPSSFYQVLLHTFLIFQKIFTIFEYICDRLRE